VYADPPQAAQFVVTKIQLVIQLMPPAETHILFVAPPTICAASEYDRGRTATCAELAFATNK
jgi:hypothetical protein